MLVLSRRVGESLVIGGDIVVTVLDVRSDGVRIGIEAPRHVRVARSEILEAVERENVGAAAADDSVADTLRRISPKPAPRPKG